MRHKIVAVGLGVCGGLLVEMRVHAVIHIPIGGVDGHVAHAVTFLLEQGAEAVALLGGVAFFEKRISKEAREMAVVRDQRFIALEVGGKVVVALFLGIEVEMRVGMIA